MLSKMLMTIWQYFQTIRATTLWCWWWGVWAWSNTWAWRPCGCRQAGPQPCGHPMRGRQWQLRAKGAAPFGFLFSILLKKSRHLGLWKLCVSHSVVSDAFLLCPWASPGKNTGVEPLPSHGDLPDPGIEPESPAFRQTLYCLRLRKTKSIEWSFSKYMA